MALSQNGSRAETRGLSNENGTCIDGNVQIIEDCIDRLVERQAARQPDAPAVCSWDVDFTYIQLDRAANRLAHYLAKQFAIIPGTLIHTCFEKTGWYIVAILAINKIGAAWVPLDPSHPKQRKQQIVQQTHATLALVSPASLSTCAGLGLHLIQVSQLFDAELVTEGTEDRHAPPRLDSSALAAYVLFTSGSTGTPKGIVMEHGAVCTSQMAISERLRLKSDVRMLQFSSFVFDASVGEIVAPLISGACVCMPSDETRLSISGLKTFVKKAKVNWAFFTPSFASLLDPSDFRTLEFVALVGEAVSRDIFDLWFGKVPRLLNGWGPSETCVFSALHEWKSREESPLTIGRAVGSYCWIVDPNDTHKLSPTGSQGEIVIQGPTLLREYLADPERTEAAVVASLPEWAPRRNSIPWNRFYKTGDLATRNKDGDLVYCSRKDTQVKVRGQRVELGEIEYHIKNNFGGGFEHVVVDIVARKSGEALVAFFSKKDEHEQHTTRSDRDTVIEFMPLDAATLIILAKTLESLKSVLPGYMIPGYFIHVREMPYSLSMKLDKKALNSAALALPSDKLAKFGLGRATEATSAIKESSFTASDEYMYLRDAWSQLLGIQKDVLNHTSHFVELGGDSIVAIKLANVMRSRGLDLSAASIFKHPQLLDMSNRVRRAQGHAAPNLEPFALLDQNSDSLINAACSVCKIRKEDIQDIYPCTPFQAGIMAISARAPSCYVATFTFSLRPSVDVARYKAAWEAVHEALPILRTRIILSDSAGEYFQVVVREGLSWREQPLSTKADMQLGKALVRYTLRQQHDTENYKLILTLHHALYDGWSLTNTMKLVEQSYMTGLVPPDTKSFNTFVQFALDCANETGAEYWRRTLSASLEPSYPALPSRTYQVLDDSMCTETTKLSTQTPSPSAYTLTTICHVAWGLLLAKYENTMDVTFGCSLSGRNADIDGINDIYGPTLTTVPFRITFDPGQSVGSLLRSAHRDYNALMGNDQYGLSNIARLGPHERRACALRTTLIIQTPDFERLEGTDDASLAKLESETPTIYGMPLTITVRIGQSADEVTARYDSQLLSPPEVSRLLQQYSHLLQTLWEVPDESKVSDLALYSPADLARFMELNPGAHRRLDSCIHDLITLSAQKYSTKRALQSWDGNLTYGELEVLSSQLGCRLSLLGVGPEVFVPLCFEKSKWAVVAMLGILKAGGAFVPLDPAHPDARLSMILEAVDARIAVTSTTLSNRLAFSENLTTIFPIDKDTFSSVGAAVDPFISNANSHNAAYAMFTSGSTGRPKGFVVGHGSYCTGAQARAPLIRRNENSRVLQFASYGFDPSVEDIMTTLMFGGCICVPSQEEMKENLGLYINQNEVNFANLTPSFVTTLDPTEASSLEVLLCSGEPMTKELVKTWAGHVELMNGYGPSETCIKCAINPNVDTGSSPRNIGFAVGANLWIIDPDNPESLVPMGAPGELMVEGPCLSRGYLRAGGSADGFIEPPAWLRKMRGNENTRVFKTGDLVHHNPDGSIEFIGRKDTQVKINGQRTELGEIESQLRRLLPESYTSTVQVVTSDKQLDGILTACIAERSAISTTSDRNAVRIVNLSHNASSEKWWNADENFSASSLQERLARTLPSYMIPKVFFAFDPIPLNINGKVNRREISSLLSQMHIDDQTRVSVDLTSTESSLLQLWRQSIRRDLGHIDASANFFDVGGDSLAAIRLAAFSRRKGLHLSVAVIHENPVLRDMAKVIPSVSTAHLSTSQPFSLISRLDDPADMVRQCAALCGVSPDRIEDLYPCTAYQEHFIVGESVFQSIFPLRPDVDIDRFKLSVQSVVQCHHSLRARIVQVNQAWFQAVVKEPIKWTITYSFRSAWDEHTFKTMLAGDDLNRFGIIFPQRTGQACFVWTSNHAVFDGWSVSSFIRQINQTYSTGAAAPELESSYGDFVRETLKTDSLECKAFWKDYFDSISCKPLCQALDGPLVDFHWHREFSPPSQFAIPVPLPTAILAAWGLVIGHQTESEDAVVSLLHLGRDAPIHGIEDMVGLLATSFPLIIRLDKSLSVQDFLSKTQYRLNSARHFQYTHPDFIRQCSAGAVCGLRSQTRCVVHPAAFHDASEESSVILDRTHRIPLKGERTEISLSFTYGGPDNHVVEMDLTFDSRAIDEMVVQSLMENFELILTQLLLQAPSEKRLHDLTWERSPALQATTITKTDLRRGEDWVPYTDI